MLKFTDIAKTYRTSDVETRALDRVSMEIAPVCRRKSPHETTYRLWSSRKTIR